jgi:hypothetical protein
MFEYTLSICCHVRTCAKFQDLLPTFVATGTGRISEDQRVEPGLGPRRTWCVVQTSSSLQPKNLHDLHENIWHNIWSTLKYHAILMEPDRFLKKLKVSQPNVALWCCLLPDVASIFHPVGCSSSCRKWMVNKQLRRGKQICSENIGLCRPRTQAPQKSRSPKRSESALPVNWHHIDGCLQSPCHHMSRRADL